MLEGQPGPEGVYPAFRDFIGGSTLWRARMRLPGFSNHRLETVCRHLFGGLPEWGRRHRALEDARLTARMWLTLMEY